MKGTIQHSLLRISDRHDELVDAFDSLYILSCNDDASAIDVGNVIKYLNKELKSINAELDRVRSSHSTANLTLV